MATVIMLSQWNTELERFQAIKEKLDTFNFFDEITIDEESNCTLIGKKDNIDFLKIAGTGTLGKETISICNKSNVLITHTGTSYTTSYLTRLVITKNGFTITNNDYTINFYIGKTDNDDLAAFVDNRNVLSLKSTDSIIYGTGISISGASETTLAKMAVGGFMPDTLADIYLIVGRQNATVGNYTLNGVNYWSDGYVMLAD